MFGLIRRFSGEDAQPAPRQNDHDRIHSPKDGINDVFNPARRLASPFRPPPLEPIVLHGRGDCNPDGDDNDDDGARLLSYAVAEEIRNMVPERLRIIEDWNLVYSLERDGSSLSTLYKKCKEYHNRRVGFVLVVQDQEGEIFGAYLSDYPHPAPSYFGNGECFLWRASTLASLPPPPSADTSNLTRSTTLAAGTAPGGRRHHQHQRPPSSGRDGGSRASTPGSAGTIRFKAFPYSGLNDFYIHCESGFLSVGSGGGHYGLWLDDSLDVGHSSMCETFGNEPLSDAGHKFSVVGVELWVLGA